MSTYVAVMCSADMPLLIENHIHKSHALAACQAASGCWGGQKHWVLHIDPGEPSACTSHVLQHPVCSPTSHTVADMKRLPAVLLLLPCARCVTVLHAPFDRSDPLCKQSQVIDGADKVKHTRCGAAGSTLPGFAHRRSLYTRVHLGTCLRFLVVHHTAPEGLVWAIVCFCGA